MGLNRRPSMLASYHNHFAGSERFVVALTDTSRRHLSRCSRAAMPQYYLPMPNVSMGPHADEHPKHAHYPTGNPHFLPLSIDVKKVG